MFALILDNTVVQVSDSMFPVAPTLTWMDSSLTPNCEPGWILLNGVLQAKPVPAPSQAELISKYKFDIINFIHGKANERNYHDTLDCISYAQSTNSTWQSQALAFIAWRDQVRASFESTIGQVQAGTIPLPSFASLIAGLPKLTWPT
jgi:hypothetical protein